MTSPRAQADNLIRSVEEAFVHAEGEWTSTGISIGSLFGVSGPQTQVLGAIRQMRTLGQTPWAARADKLTATDQAGWDRWVQDGNDILKNLAGTAQDASSASLPGIVAETVKATAVDVKEGTAKVAKAAYNARYLILAAIGLIVVGLVAWKWRSG